jgi:Fe-S-cluster containining protein
VKLHLHDRLPLTCTREGTCCHGKAVWIHPGELARLAAFLTLPVAEVMARHTTDGGIRLAFDGPPGWRNLAACTFYVPGQGCRAHPARPLACRLYPLGRERSGAKVRYLHEGRVFPCLTGCPTVVTLPAMTVRDYLAGQEVGPGEAAQDAYLDLASDLAEAAFAVAFDSGLVAAGHPLLPAWRAMAAHGPTARATALGLWHGALLGLDLNSVEEPGSSAWITAHRTELQARLQASFAALPDPAALTAASATCLGMALHVVQSLGGDPMAAAERWLGRARGLGAR